VVWWPRATESKGRKNWRQNKYFKYKNFDFPRSTNFKLASEIEGLIISIFILYVTGGQCDYSPRAPRKLATPLFCI